jgi:hypothetical protein
MFCDGSTATAGIIGRYSADAEISCRMSAENDFSDLCGARFDDAFVFPAVEGVISGAAVAVGEAADSGAVF